MSLQYLIFCVCIFHSRPFYFFYPFISFHLYFLGPIFCSCPNSLFECLSVHPRLYPLFTLSFCFHLSVCLSSFFLCLSVFFLSLSVCLSFPMVSLIVSFVFTFLSVCLLSLSLSSYLCLCLSFSLPMVFSLWVVAYIVILL